MYEDIKFHYSAGSMGWGNGRFWHRFVSLPDFPRITKTVTLNPKIGRPWAIAHLGTSIWNWQGLPNSGYITFSNYIEPFLKHPIILSIAGTDNEILVMMDYIERYRPKNVTGIELNFSCPNVKNHKNKSIPKSRLPLYLKLNCTQSPQDYDLSKISKISVNSVPCAVGALSGKLAQKKNWKFIKQHIDLPISGASWRTKDDLNRLLDMGCRSIDVGTALLTNPKLIGKLCQEK